jgi:hypothetical protein
MSEYYCRVCEEYDSDDFYAVKSHVYTSHGEQTCGIAHLYPETYVETAEEPS